MVASEYGGMKRMREFNDRGGRGGGFRRDFSGPREPREEFDAICSDCGVACKVPFKPATDKPVYCRECHRKRRPPRDFDRAAA